MHSLALLCNLHADGPTSLHRLREAGVETLEGVRSSQQSALSGWLGVGLPAASRFRKEAELLAARVDSGLLEEEDGVAPSQPIGHSLPPAHEDRAPRFPLEVLPEVLNGEVARSEPGPRLAPEPQPRPAPRRGLAIDSADLDWLTPERRVGLRQSGLETLGDLVGMDVMDLARVLGETFSGARRLQFLASRVPAVAADAVAAPLPSRTRFQRQRTRDETPRADAGSDAAGPFA